MRTSALVEPLRRARAAGWSIGDLAALYHLDRAEVRRIVAGPGPTDRARAAAARRLDRAQRDTAIRELRSAGWSVAALADRFSLSASTVSTIAKGLGAPDADPADAPIVAVGPPLAPARAAGPIAVDSSSSEPASESASWGDDVHRGAAHGRAQLDEAQAAELRRLKTEGWTYLALAERFGVSRSTVWYVLSGRTWSYVGPA